MLKSLLVKLINWISPPDQRDCYGCHLDRQWVGGERTDHTCAGFGE